MQFQLGSSCFEVNKSSFVSVLVFLLNVEEIAMVPHFTSISDKRFPHNKLATIRSDNCRPSHNKNRWAMVCSFLFKVLFYDEL